MAFLISSNKKILKLLKLIVGLFVAFLVVIVFSFLLDTSDIEKNVQKGKLIFPEGFYFGASTSAHQVEGRSYNQWTKWEKENADRLASEASPLSNFGGGKATVPNWEIIKFQAKDKENYISGTAIDHYNKYPEDLAIAKKIGLNAYRFSLEWSRIEPEEGKFDSSEIEHYRQMIRTVRLLGMEPFVGLWHWTEPLWFTKKGGWESREAIGYFEHYVKKVMENLRNEVNYWIPVNEIEIYAGMSYFLGLWPPQKRNFFAYRKVTRNLIKAHEAAYYIIKENSDAKVGSALNYTYFQPAGGLSKPFNIYISRFANRHLNQHTRKSINNTSDFHGLNYYQRCVIRGTKIFYAKEKVPRSDMGWELYPQGILFVLRDLKKYKKPIIVTENGLADAQDKYRVWYIKSTLGYIAQAIQEGIDVKGYFYWSLLDNFEWDKDFWPQFGLIYVDRNTKERTIRPSALEYAKIIQESKK